MSARVHRFGATPALILILSLLLGGCAELYFYAPSQSADGSPPAGRDGIEDVHFHSGDGTRLHGWFVRAQGRARGTVIHFHGNNKNVGGHFRYVGWLPEHGYNVFLFDYRGYGASEGRPYPKGLHEDCLAAIRFVRSRADVDANRLLIFGQSLGGTCALTALAASPAAGIRAAVVEGTFSSHRAIALEKIGHYPLPEALKAGLVNTFIAREADAEDAISAIGDTPLLLIHGTQDDVVPYRHAQRLYAAANGRKTLWTVEGGRHLDTFVQRAVPYRQRLLDFFAATLENGSR